MINLLIWDTYAIAEYLAEVFPEKKLWPLDKKLRARARCISAEMHSGFSHLRELCTMNIRANFKNMGEKLWSNNHALREDLARIEKIWSERPNYDSFLCGDFSIADSFYVPVITRIQTYCLPVSEDAQRYINTMLTHPTINAWIQDALNETEKVNYYEIYNENE